MLLLIMRKIRLIIETIPPLLPAMRRWFDDLLENLNQRPCAFAFVRSIIVRIQIWIDFVAVLGAKPICHHSFQRGLGKRGVFEHKMPQLAIEREQTIYVMERHTPLVSIIPGLGALTFIKKRPFISIDDAVIPLALQNPSRTRIYQ